MSAEKVADKATLPNACDDPRVRYDEEVRLTANGKPIPKGLTPWRKGQSGNPGGRPKGFVGPTRAYNEVSQLSLKEVERLAQGKFPVGWKHGNQMIYCQKARELLEAHKKATPMEINGRMEGPIVQRIDLNLDGGPLAILAQLAPPAAAQRLEEAIDTPALPPGNDPA